MMGRDRETERERAVLALLFIDRPRPLPLQHAAMFFTKRILGAKCERRGRTSSPHPLISTPRVECRLQTAEVQSGEWRAAQRELA